MYQIYTDHIQHPCDEQTPVWRVLVENALLLISWVAAGVMLWPLQFQAVPIATIIWGGLIATLQVLLKKHVCSGCYYYGKTCHLGWGHLSKMLFEQDSGSPGLGIKLAVVCYMIAPAVALVTGIIAGVLLPFSTPLWFVMGVFVLANILSGALRPGSCGRCAIRTVCAGSAAKLKP